MALQILDVLGAERLREAGLARGHAIVEAVRLALESDPAIGIVVMETIQGGGGIVEAPDGFWRELRTLCDKHGVLWVADEVQCELGRTGPFSWCRHPPTSRREPPDRVGRATSGWR